MLGGTSSLGFYVLGKRGADGVLRLDGGRSGPEHRPHRTLGGE